MQQILKHNILMITTALLNGGHFPAITLNKKQDDKAEGNRNS